MRLEALAARARIGEEAVRKPLEAIAEAGPDWRRFIAKAALVALGDEVHLAFLHGELTRELDRTYLHNSRRAYEIIRLTLLRQMGILFVSEEGLIQE